MNSSPTRMQVVMAFLRRQKATSIAKCLFWLTTDFRNYRKVGRFVSSRFLRNRTRSEAPKFELPSIPPELHTKRLTLRKIVKEDLIHVFNLMPREEQIHSDSDDPRPLWRQELALASEILNASLIMVAVQKENQKIVGMLGITEFLVNGNMQIELGYRVHSNHFGEGLATESASALRDYMISSGSLPGLVSIISPHNKASIRVAEKIGMRFQHEWKINQEQVHIYSLESSF